MPCPDFQPTGFGADLFRFNGATDGGDLISDFIAGVDALQVSAAGFGGGLLSGMDLVLTDRLVFGSGATQNFGQFIYDGASGTLSWDADGTGGGAVQQIAILSGLPLLGGSNIRVIV